MNAVLEGKLGEAGLSEAELTLMRYVEEVTHAASRTTHEDVQRLRDVGSSENQISEAVYIIALFAFFNRVADAFGIPTQNYLVRGKLTP